LIHTEFVFVLSTFFSLAFGAKDTDRYAGAAYNHYESLEQFYEEMSALGDFSMEDLHGEGHGFGLANTTSTGTKMDTPFSSDFHHDPSIIMTKSKKIANLSIPFLVLQALDDPVSSWRCNADNAGVGHPQQLVQLGGGGNLVLLLTKTGGHVGWPLGWWPSHHNWKFMSTVASGFVNAIVDEKRREQSVATVAVTTEP
jgi:hypothetical protein